MNEQRPDNRMSKFENGSTRRETTTVDDFTYDVVFLEKYLEEHPEINEPVDVPLSDPRLSDSVGEGNTYWASKSGEKLGPSHFSKLWEQSKTTDPSKTVDEFLEELKTTHPDMEEHAESLKFAKSNLSRPIWLFEAAGIHSRPFDGMHRLTRAYLEGLPSIKAIVWESLPGEAKLNN